MKPYKDEATQVEIGEFTYIVDKSEFMYVKIGKFCSIASGVKIGLGGHPVNEFISTYPAFYAKKNSGCKVSFVHKQLYDEFKLTEICHDVWIGLNAIIMDGVKIGNGAIIGAGSVVTKNVPSYAVVAGNPAKIIRYRFNESQREILEEFKWWDKDIEWIMENATSFRSDDFFIKLNDNNFINSYKKRNFDATVKEIAIGITDQSHRKRSMDFSKDFNKFFDQINSLNEKYVIYGYGTIGKTIRALMHENIVAFVDRTSSLISEEIINEEVYSPKNLPNIKYDKIIISVLGREVEIIRYLVEDLHVSKDKIVTLHI